MNNYIIIGDSIAYGIGDNETGGWASMFKKYIVNLDDSKVCNNYVHISAFPGATSTIILNKIDNIYKAFRNDEFRNTIILSIGVNDTQEFNGNLKTSLDDYEMNIQRIIDYVKEQGSELIILGLTRIASDEKFFWKPGKYYWNKIISNYDYKLEILCHEKNIKYISMKDALDESDYIDGLHPNTIGHKKIFEIVKESISK